MRVRSAKDLTVKDTTHKLEPYVKQHDPFLFSKRGMRKVNHCHESTKTVVCLCFTYTYETTDVSLSGYESVCSYKSTRQVFKSIFCEPVSDICPDVDTVSDLSHVVD